MRLLKRIGMVSKIVIFIVIFIILFENINRLFVYEGSNAKIRIRGFYEEPADSIDVVFVGPSSIYPFFSPGLAFHEFGFTSYLLATPGMSIPAIEYVVEEVEKTQSPKVYVIDIRRALVHEETYKEIEIRRLFDNMPLSETKWRAIDNMVKEDKISYMLGMIKYHSRWKELNDIDYDVLFRKTDVTKGFQPYYETMALGDVVWNKENEERGPISEKNEKLLRELLSYCKENNIHALFKVAPWCLTKSKRQKANYVKDIVAEYGYEMIDANDYYDEMEWDFNRDMSDKRHANVYGATKYTRFLSKYITEHYELEDKRGNADYESWNASYLDYLKTWNEMERNKDNIKPPEDVK